MQFDGISWPPLTGIQDGEYKLTRTQNALNLLDNPEKKIKNIIHIGGTNGKGSTSSFIQNILNKNNFTVNLYTSPHLITPNERIQIHSKNISNENLTQTAKKVYYVLKKHGLENSLTYFEAMTVIAFQAFSETNADFNIFEVGLGGRFDATNVILHPLISIITAISLDHTDYLGDTLTQIAIEKCEIIKKNSLAIMSFQEITAQQQDVYNIFTKKCQIMNAEFSICKEIIKFNNNLDSTFQAQNATTALNAISLIGKKINHNFNYNTSIEAILSTKWRGRMQNIFINEIQREILIDCAHNIAGIQHFLDFISKKNKKKVLIFGMLQRKITKDIINILQNALNTNTIDKIITVNFGEESINATDLSTKIAHKNCRPSQNFMEALILSKQFDEIFLCGSIHLVGEFFKEFNLYNS